MYILQKFKALLRTRPHDFLFWNSKLYKELYSINYRQISPQRFNISVMILLFAIFTKQFLQWKLKK